MTNTLYMMIGIPGSGKSTVANTLSNYLNIPVVSSDKVREELTGSEEDFSKDGLVWGKAIPLKLNKALTKGDAIFDATNLRLRDRNKLCKSLIPHEKVAVFVSIPLEECIRRQDLRDRKVPSERIREMYDNLMEPTFNEGFSNIYIVKDSKTLVEQIKEDREEKCKD